MEDGFLIGTCPGEDLLPSSKAHVLSVLSATGRVYSFCDLQKRNGDIYLNIYKIQVRILDKVLCSLL